MNQQWVAGVTEDQKTGEDAGLAEKWAEASDFFAEDGEHTV